MAGKKIMPTDWKRKEREWINWTESGNACFSAGAFGDALAHYIHSLEIAAELLDGHGMGSLDAGVPVVPIFTISCNNLANTHWEMGNLEAADCCFRDPLSAIKAVAQDPSACDAMRQEALREVTRIMVTYLDFCGETGRDSGAAHDSVVRIELGLKPIHPN